MIKHEENRNLYRIPFGLPSITFEPHPDGLLYVVHWGADLDRPLIESMWLSLGTSLDQFLQTYGVFGERVLHTKLYTTKDRGVYSELRQLQFLLVEGGRD